ncbi:L,D-transpeptidase catalytic domain [Lentzea albidocapillata subsp. violacea]|uniref:L,D-transpeptidase catalytic domain n=1 Tax=Lentzea albidocapillata subsp. violacea TaxID=128104 RepID=A0A1G9G3X3_9PSEU|nr:L,D-transpeptidase [Lentzea albidocapillata]SDK95388.1 L,D-transpeptidase catalytic domain [Lentzea albidocapillata subsp. violacea]
MRVLAVTALFLLGFALPAQASGCTVHNGACVQKHTNLAWLVTNGVTSYGPVRISHGKPGFGTPVGNFPVLRKVKNDWSVPYNGPMPNAVYFTADGVAFHQGDLNSQSHGCVRLTWNDSEVFYNNLFPGERIQVLP